MKTHHSFCRNCPSACGLLIDVADDRIMRIRGDRAHPLTGGYFCVKGLSSMDLHNGEDRLFASRLKGSGGGQEDISSERAMDEIHQRLSAIIARHGAGSVALYYGTGANNHALCHSAMKGWMHAIGSPYLFSSMTVDQSAKWVAIGRMGYYTPGKHSSNDADLLMLAGINPLVSHMSSTLPMAAPGKALRAARARGMKLIVVDPRRTETARHADLHLPVRPGEDAALFAGMIRIVLERGWQDQAFCDRFVDGVEALREAVDPFDLAVVSDRTGLRASRIEEACEMFAHAGRRSAETGTGPSMSPRANLNIHLVESLNAICGAYRRAGDVVRNAAPLFGRSPPAEMVIPAMRPWEGEPKLKETGIGPLFGEYPTPLLHREIGSERSDRIRALFVVGGNPAKAISDPSKTLAALRKLDLLVTIDARPTETAAMSDYVIATSLPYERYDFNGLLEDFLKRSFVQISEPIVNRPAGVIDDWEFFWGLASRAGLPLELKRPLFGQPHLAIPGPVLTLEPERKSSTREIIAWMMSHGRLSYDELASAPSGLAFEDAIVIAPADPAMRTRLQLCPDDVRQEISVLADAPDGSTLPFRLTVRRQLESMNSAFNHAGRTRRRYPVNPAFMHPDDMVDLGIADGSKVRIVSGNGNILATAAADSDLIRGVVSISHGWGSPDRSLDPESVTGAFVGHLVSIEDELEDISFMPRQSAIPVSVRPA